MNSAFRIALAVTLLSLGGCGQDRYVGAWGEVTYEGESVDGGTIVFIPMKGTAGPSGGTTITKGSYDIPANQGLLRDGQYRVEIIALKPSGQYVPPHTTKYGSTAREVVKNYIPTEYNSMSILKVKITSTSSRERFDFRLEKRPAAKDR